MKRGLSILGIAALGALAAAGRAPAAAPAGTKSVELPAVMRRISGKCAMAVVFRNMQSFSVKINKLARLVSPHASKETVRQLFKSVGSTRGINFAGSAAWVLARLPKNVLMAMQMPDVAFIIPVRNAKAFLAPLRPQALRRGVERVTLAHEDEPMYAASLGKFVILSYTPNMGQFTNIKTSLAATMAAPLARRCAGTDAFFYVSPVAMEARTIAYAKLAYTGAQNMGNFNGAAKKNAPKPRVHYSSLARWQLGMAIAKTVMNSTPQMVIGMHMGAHGGLTLVQQAIVKKNSALGRILQRNGALPEKPLAGLPVTGNCLVAAAGAFDGSGVAQAVQTINQAMLRKNPKFAKSGFEVAELPGFLKDIALFRTQQFELLSPPLAWVVVSKSPHPRRLRRAIEANLQTHRQRVVLKSHALVSGGYSFTRARWRFAGSAGPGAPAGSRVGPRRRSELAYLGTGHGREINLLRLKNSAGLSRIIKHLVAGGNALARRMQILSGGQKVLAHPGFLAFLPLDRWGAASGAATPANALVTGVAPSPVVVSGAEEKTGLRLQVDVPRRQVHDLIKYFVRNAPTVPF